MEIAVDSFFIVFVHQLDELGPPIAYRGDWRERRRLRHPPRGRGRRGSVNRYQQELELFTVTEFQPS